jgi:glycosyltransferase involved in cell wall biosynthesis
LRVSTCQSVRRGDIITNRYPKVSIGIPVFNGANYLSETIESLLAQSFENFELVISDNASTDGTEDICRHYVARDRRVRYERQQSNNGAPWNYNRAFELCQGTYFKWHSHDDLCAPNFLARCVEVLDLNPSIVCCQSRVGVIDAQGIAINTHDCGLSGAAEVLTVGENGRPELADSTAMRFAHQRFRCVLLGNNACFDIDGLIRSEALQRISLWRPYFGWEKVLISALVLRGRCAEIPEELFFFRVHDKACSARATFEEETAWSNPNQSKSTFNVMVRYHLLAGHFRNILEAPIGFWERIHCCWGIGNYLFQFHKWRSVVPQILKNKGIGGSTRAVLRKLEDPQSGLPENLLASRTIHMVSEELESQGTHRR